MIEMLLLCSITILVVIGLRLLFRKHVSSIISYCLWLPTAVCLLLAPVAYLLTGAAAEIFAAAAPLSYIFLLVWLSGATALAVWLLLTEWELRKKLQKDAEPYVCPESPVPVWVSPCMFTPCLFGLLRPAIYLTPDVAADPARCSHVLAHELTHYKHKDHIWSFVRRLCLIIYWFHPLVWLAARLSKQDSELACDEGALKRLGDEQRMAYGRTIVEVAETGFRRDSSLQDRETTQRYCKYIAKVFTIKARFCILLIVLLAVGSLCCLLLLCPGKEDVVLEKVELAQTPTLCQYVLGETLDTRGMKLRLCYSDGTTQLVTDGFTCSPEKFEMVGKQTVTVIYGDQTVKFLVEIGEVSKSGTCGENLKWVLTKQGSLIITGTGPMTNFRMDETPWSSTRVLYTVSLSEGVTTIGTAAFDGDNIQSIRIPTTVVRIERSALDVANKLEGIWVAPGNAHYVSDEYGVLYTKDYQKVVRYPVARRGDYQVVQGCQVIGEEAFRWCTISQLTLPDTIHTIEANAFHECHGFPELILPKSVSYVDASAILYSSVDRITFLNPQCRIDSKNYMARYNTTVYGYKNSDAWQYARKYGFKFEEIT